MRWRLRLFALSGFVARLSERVRAHVPRAVSEGGARRAAVAVVVSDDPEPALLFIRRAVRVGDPWSGQMAFPGGFQAGPDESALDTARRETVEETGLDLSLASDIGALDDLHPRTPHLPPVVVTPWVFVVPERSPVVPGAEADAALWIPAGDLFAPEYHSTLVSPLPGRAREFASIRVGAHVIWGLTERILAQIGDLGGLNG